MALALQWPEEPRDGGFTQRQASGVSNVTFFMGVLSAPTEGERKKRDAYMSECVPQLQPWVDSGVLRWAFFIGFPQTDEEAIFALGETAHEQGLRYSAETQQQMRALQKEVDENGHIR